MQRPSRVSEGCCLFLSGCEAVSHSSYSFGQIIGSPGSGSVGGKEPGSEQASCKSWCHNETLRSMTSLRRTIVIQTLAQTYSKHPLYPLCFLKAKN